MGIGQSSHDGRGSDPQDSPESTARVERCFGALPDIRSIVWPKVAFGDDVCDLPEDVVDRRNSKRSTPDESAVQKELESIFEEAEKEALSTNDFFLLVPGELPDSEFTFSRDNNSSWIQSEHSNVEQPQNWERLDTTNAVYPVQHDRHFRPVGILQPRPRLDFDRVVHSGPASTENLFIPIHDLDETSASELGMRNTPELRRRDELPHFRLKPRMEASNRTEIPDTR